MDKLQSISNIFISSYWSTFFIKSFCKILKTKLKNVPETLIQIEIILNKNKFDILLNIIV